MKCRSTDGTKVILSDNKYVGTSLSSFIQIYFFKFLFYWTTNPLRCTFTISSSSIPGGV